MTYFGRHNGLAISGRRDAVARRSYSIADVDYSGAVARLSVFIALLGGQVAGVKNLSSTHRSHIINSQSDYAERLTLTCHEFHFQGGTAIIDVNHSPYVARLEAEINERSLQNYEIKFLRRFHC